MRVLLIMFIKATCKKSCDRKIEARFTLAESLARSSASTVKCSGYAYRRSSSRMTTLKV